MKHVFLKVCVCEVFTSESFPSACVQPGGGGGGVPEAHVVMQVTVDDFVTLVQGYVQVQK